MLRNGGQFAVIIAVTIAIINIAAVIAAIATAIITAIICGISKRINSNGNTLVAGNFPFAFFGYNAFVNIIYFLNMY